MLTSRELQRIQSIAKSPLLSHVNASVAGAATVRAFGSSSINLSAQKKQIYK
jgi:hypothetical protein